MSNNFVRSIPMIGNKWKILPQLLPCLERPQFNRFIDLTCGSGVVGINTSYKNILLNDTNFPMLQILQKLYQNTPEQSLEVLDAVINNSDFKKEFIKNYPEHLKKLKDKKRKTKDLSKLFKTFKQDSDYILNAQNKNAYLLLRAIYNEKLTDPYILLALIYHSFQNMFRLNKARGEFNVPFGERTFNNIAKQNLIDFINHFQTKTAAFMDQPIEFWNYGLLTPTDLVYVDPPYSTGGAAYNAGWNGEVEKVLLTELDYLSDREISWAMSNAFKNNGKENKLLMNWAEKYEVIYLDNDYSNSYYTRSKAKTLEVLIKNYE